MRYDCTLLAAIGILEEMKYQTNVAGWLRSGGLWADHGPFSKGMATRRVLSPRGIS